MARRRVDTHGASVYAPVAAGLGPDEVIVTACGIACRDDMRPSRGAWRYGQSLRHTSDLSLVTCLRCLSILAEAASRALGDRVLGADAVPGVRVTPAPASSLQKGR